MSSNEIKLHVVGGIVDVVRIDNDSVVVRPRGASYDVDVPADAICNWEDFWPAPAKDKNWLIVTRRYAGLANMFVDGYQATVTIETPTE